MRAANLWRQQPWVGVLAGVFVACGGSGDGGGGPYSLGENIAIRVQPSSIVFPAVGVDNVAVERVTVEHVGDGGTLNVTALALDTESPGEFMLCAPGTDVTTCIAPGAMALEPGDTQEFQVFYTPKDATSDRGHVVLQHNATNQDPVTSKGVTRIPITTMTAASQVYVSPNYLDFGPVRENEERTLDATIINGGTKGAQVTAIGFSGATSPDFEWGQKPEEPIDLAANGRSSFSVRYRPTPNPDGQSLTDEGRVEIYYVEEGSTDERLIEVRLAGYLTAPEITVLPGAIDFGWVLVGQNYDRALTLRNDGTEPLHIANIYLSELSNDFIGLRNLPEQFPHELLPAEGDALGESAMVLVTFQATEPFPLSTDPIGTVVIESDDRDEALLSVPVYARLQAPALVATPSDLVDFGVVPLYDTRQKQVTLFNAGQADLWVDSVAIDDNPTDEFVIRPLPSFPPLADPAGRGVIAAGTSVVLALEFTNNGPAQGEQWGNLHIVSNDPNTPALDIALKATRTGAPECRARLNPTMLDFGIVPHGSQKTQAINIESYGSGHCSFRSSAIGACGGLPIPGFGATCDPNSQINQNFAVTAQPIPTPLGLQSGTSTPVSITFTPPENVPLIPDFDVYYGFFRVTVYDPNVGDGGCTSDTDCPTDRKCYGGFCGFTLPNVPATGTVQPNLTAKSGVSDISVLPEEIDFGLVTIGCRSQEMTITVYNTGTAPLQMSDVHLEGCGPEFDISGLPPLPADVSANQPLTVKVVYVPQDLGEDACTVVIASSDRDTPTFTVPLRGEGTHETHHVDVFTQISGQNVDILFVVDDSGSMCEEQDRLASNMESFIQHAQQWGNSYQIGVISVCINAEQCDGPGELKTEYGETERWVEPTTWPHFQSNVELGCSGNSDAQEAGLEAARKALTLPIAHTSQTACNADADCQAPDTCMEWHGQKRCGGWNAGFLRDDAALELVFLSDEEDQSTPTPDFYVDFFRSIKGFANTNLFHAHSIVGDEGGGCGDSNSGGTTADGGDRYIYVTDATGGVFESICNDSFASALSEIGNIAFGLKVQFFLTRAAEPSTVVVTVNGVRCTYGYDFDQPSNSIIFQGREGEPDPCRLPQPGDEIVVEYDAICYTP